MVIKSFSKVKRIITEIKENRNQKKWNKIIKYKGQAVYFPGVWEA
jgi:hypothetical protein